MMLPRRTVLATVGTGMMLASTIGLAAELPKFTRKSDVIYGRKYGTALTLDVITPAKPNGAAVLWMISGGFFSDHRHINPAFVALLLDRGYTVFAVVHGSQPKFTIPEIVEDIYRATRFIRHNAKEYKIDPNRIGVTGGSAGGHLSLMLGTTGTAGDPRAPDPIDRQSSKVQAVACFFPPTDFLNYGKPGEIALGTGVLSGFKAPFDFQQLDPKTRAFVLITDEKQRQQIGRAISPAYHVTAQSAPTLIIHGDADTLVPIQQAQIVIEKLKAANVPAKLITKPNAAHGWPTLIFDMALIADWFDEQLKPKDGANSKP